jgi:hypothetical protein
MAPGPMEERKRGRVSPRLRALTTTRMKSNEEEPDIACRYRSGAQLMVEQTSAGLSRDAGSRDRKWSHAREGKYVKGRRVFTRGLALSNRRRSSHPRTHMHTRAYTRAHPSPHPQRVPRAPSHPSTTRYGPFTRRGRGLAKPSGPSIKVELLSIKVQKFTFYESSASSAMAAVVGSDCPADSTPNPDKLIDRPLQQRLYALFTPIYAFLRLFTPRRSRCNRPRTHILPGLLYQRFVLTTS